MVGLSATEVRGLCLKTREILLSQPMLLELEAPIKICGKSFYYSLCEFLNLIIFIAYF